MSLNVNGYTAEGPYTNPYQLDDRSGVYIVLTKNGAATSYSAVDIGESRAVVSRLTSHDRQPCWDRNNRGTLYYAAIYADQYQRMVIERELRSHFGPVCGDR